MSKISSLVLLSKLTSLNAMQIEISFAAAYDFNQYTQYVPRPRPLAFRQSPLELRTFWFSFSGNGQYLFEFELLLGYLSEVLKVTHYDQHGLQV